MWGGTTRQLKAFCQKYPPPWGSERPRALQPGDQGQLTLTLTNYATLGRFLKLSPCYFPHLKYGDSDPASWSLGETVASFTQLVNTCATLALGLPGRR